MKKDFYITLTVNGTDIGNIICEEIEFEKEKERYIFKKEERRVVALSSDNVKRKMKFYFKSGETTYYNLELTK